MNSQPHSTNSLHEAGLRKPSFYIASLLILIFSSLILSACAEPQTESNAARPATSADADSGPDYPPITIPQSQVHPFTAANGWEYALEIILPTDYDAAADPGYPTLYVLDGQAEDSYQTYFAQNLLGELDPVIIVGIAYPGDDINVWLSRRIGELTHSANADMDALFTAEYQRPTHTGDGEIFRQILNTEIIPYIDDAFKTSPDRSLVGFSLGGLFAAYDLLQSDRMFGRYGIGSPSLWWEQTQLIRQAEQNYHDSHDDLDAKVFLSVGEFESPEGEDQFMVRDMEWFAETLRSRNYPSLEIHTVIFEDEDHLSVIPVFMSRFVKVMLRKPDVSADETSEGQ